MKTEPDIYAENPIVDLDYKIAVMQAARQSGNLVQIIGPTFSRWSWCPNPNFNWEMNKYRIDPACKPQPPKIAEGNNPDNLTEDQVGVKDGWRLVTKEELEHRTISICKQTNDAVVYSTSDRRWNSNCSVEMRTLKNTYRTKKPAGFFLPKPKVKVPLTLREYLGATLWFRLKLHPYTEGLAVCFDFDRNFIYLNTADTYSKLFTPLDLSSNFEYSTDRVNWKPCYKEVEQ